MLPFICAKTSYRSIWEKQTQASSVRNVTSKFPVAWCSRKIQKLFLTVSQNFTHHIILTLMPIHIIFPDNFPGISIKTISRNSAILDLLNLLCLEKSVIYQLSTHLSVFYQTRLPWATSAKPRLFFTDIKFLISIFNLNLSFTFFSRPLLTSRPQGSTG